MTSSLIIREATPADVTSVVPLLGELGYPVDSATLAQRFQNFTLLGESALLAEKDSVLLGLLTLHVTNVLHRAGPVGRVTALVVSEAAQGQGVGRALMKEAEKRLWEKGCVFIEITSNKKRTEAHAFYGRLGYEQTSFRFGKVRTPGT